MNLLFLLLLLSLSACSERPPPPPPPPRTESTPIAAPSRDAEAAAEGATTLVVTTQGDQMRFLPEQLQAPAGVIVLEFTNAATTAGMQHNVVVVRAGTADRVGPAAIAAGEGRDYVPDSPDVLGATPMLGPGQSGALQVTLSPGEYEYICTFPGHYLQMRGTLQVTGPPQRQ